MFKFPIVKSVYILFCVDEWLHIYEPFNALLKLKYFNPQTWPSIVCYRIKPNVSRFEVSSEWMLYDTGPIWVSCEHLEKSKPEKKKRNKKIEQLCMVHHFYIPGKEVLEGGKGEIRGAFEQVLTAHIFNAILFSIALRPGLSKRSSFFYHFFHPFFYIIDVFTTHPPIARSRWSRLYDIFLYSAARRLLLSLFPNVNVADI